MVSTNSKTKYCIKYGGTKCNKTVIRTILKYINNYNREESGKRKIEKGIEREKDSEQRGNIRETVIVSLIYNVQ